MTRPIPRAVHGAIDYLYAAAVAASPWAFGFVDRPIAAWLAWAVAAGVVGYSLFTRYEWGAVRLIADIGCGPEAGRNNGGGGGGVAGSGGTGGMSGGAGAGQGSGGASGTGGGGGGSR